MLPRWIETSRFCPYIVFLLLAGSFSFFLPKKAGDPRQALTVCLLSVYSFHLTARSYTGAVLFPTFLYSALHPCMLILTPYLLCTAPLAFISPASAGSSSPFLFPADRSALAYALLSLQASSLPHSARFCSLHLLLSLI
jgi:hypothetical protein